MKLKELRLTLMNLDSVVQTLQLLIILNGNILERDSLSFQHTLWSTFLGNVTLALILYEKHDKMEDLL